MYSSGVGMTENPRQSAMKRIQYRLWVSTDSWLRGKHDFFRTDRPLSHRLMTRLKTAMIRLTLVAVAPIVTNHVDVKFDSSPVTNHAADCSVIYAPRLFLCGLDCGLILLRDPVLLLLMYLPILDN